MSPKLSDAVRSLERAKQTAVRRLEELDRERTEIKNSIKSLDAALKTLASNGATTTVTGKKRKAATTAEVVALLEDALSDGREMSMDDVVERLSGKLLERGKTRAGLKLRINQALHDQRFEQTQNGIRLS